MRGLRRRSLLVVTGCVFFLVIGEGVTREVERIVLKSRSGAPLPEEIIRANMRTAAGETLDRSTLAEDVKRLYETGYFKPDIQTQVRETGEDKVEVVLSLALRPLIDTVEIRGNDKVGKSFLREKVNVYAGERLKEKEVMQTKAALLSVYRQKGYYRADIEPLIQDSASGHKVDVVFDVDEGPKVKIGRISFKGNEAFSDKRLRKQFRNRHRWWHLLFGGIYQEEVFENDLRRLRSFYSGNGFLDFNVENVDETLSANKKRLHVTITVSEGEPYQVETVVFEGNDYFSPAELREQIVSRAGETFNVQAARQDARRIQRQYADHGYVDAQCRLMRTADSKEHTVNLTYRINEDGTYDVRDVVIDGNTITKAHVIRRELAVHPGDELTGRALRTSRRRLQNLGYFKNVRIEMVPTEEVDKKDVRITVEEQKTGRLMVGGGYSTEADLVGTLEVMQANFDWLDWPTFTGGGQKLRLRLQVGTERNQFSLSFTEPWLFHQRLRLNVDAYVKSRDEDEYTREEVGGSVSITRPWFGRWEQRFGLRIETVELTDIDDIFEANLAAPLREEGDRHGVYFDVIRDTRNSVRYPTRGSRFRLGVDVMSEVWGSYSDIYKLQVEGTKYFPVFGKSTLKLSGTAGAVDNISGPDVAIFDRFFAGGSYSVRGFERREVGPTTQGGDEPVGGEATMEGTLAFLYPFTNNVRGILFCDAGNVWRQVGDVNPSELNISVGAGVKFDLPIGPLRFDYGIPVRTEQEHLEGASGRLHFNLGYMF